MNFRTHNGTITVRSLKTGEHRTIRCQTKKFPDGETKRVVSLLTGPERWTGFAFATLDGVRLWQRYQGSKVFEFLAGVADGGGEGDGRIEVMAEGRCRVCGRPLTNPESLRLGAGPICAEKFSPAF